MATTVPNNPFDVQPASQNGQGIVGGAISDVMTGQNATAQNFAQYNPLQGLSVQQYTPQTREVNRATETAAGQVESLLAKDNPLLQRARTIALQNMNQRGLVNSSMAQGAGVAAMVDRITPIAQQDAATYSNRALANMDATNRANEFNVGQNNQLFSQGLNIASQFGLQDLSQKFQTAEREASQTFQTGEREASQTFQTGEREATQKFQSYESLLQREFTAEENNLDRVQQMRIVELQEAGANRRQAETIAAQERAQASQQAFERAQAAAAQQFQAQQAELQRAQEQALAQAQIQANKELQAAQQSFQGAQAELERAQQVALADKSIAAQQDLQSAQQSFQSAQAELDRTQQVSLQTSQQSFQTAQAELDRAQQTNIANLQVQANKDLATANQNFTAAQNQLDRQNQEKLINLQNDLAQANVSKNFAASTALNTSNAINQILADPNVAAADKKGAIDNIVTSANSTLQWGATFYNTKLPTITAPGQTPGTVSPGPGAGTGTAKPFDDAAYLRANPDVAAAGVDPLTHYNTWGRGEGRTW